MRFADRPLVLLVLFTTFLACRSTAPCSAHGCVEIEVRKAVSTCPFGDIAVAINRDSVPHTVVARDDSHPGWGAPHFLAPGGYFELGCASLGPEPDASMRGSESTSSPLVRHVRWELKEVP